MIHPVERLLGRAVLVVVERDEVPMGAVVVRNGRIITRAFSDAGEKCEFIFSNQFKAAFAFDPAVLVSLAENLTFCAIAIEWPSRKCP